MSFENQREQSRPDTQPAEIINHDDDIAGKAIIGQSLDDLDDEEFCSEELQSDSKETESSETRAPSTLEVLSKHKPTLRHSDPLVAQVLFDDYAVLSLIGTGANSSVYRAKQLSENKLVAIKTSKFLQEEIISAFAAAARTHLELKHTNIVRSIAFLESPLNRPFFVMEYVTGVSIHEVIDAAGSFDDEEEITDILCRVCDALEYAHEKKVFHGGLSIDNVMLVEDEEAGLVVQVLDFGFAGVNKSIAAIEAKRSGAPQPNVVLSELDLIRLDIFLLGQLAYQMVTGRTLHDFSPTDGETRFLSVAQICPDLFAPEEFDRLLEEALDSDPDCRYESVVEFRTALLTWLQKAEIARVVHEEAKEADGSSRVRDFTKGSRSKSMKQNLISSIHDLVSLRQTQIREDQTMAMQLASIAAAKGPRRSPRQTIALMVAQIVGSSLLALVCATYIICNWDKLCEGWVAASRFISTQGKSPDEVVIETEIPVAGQSVSRPSTERKSIQAANQQIDQQQTANKRPANPLRRKFKYEESPVYNHIKLIEIGKKRRLGE